MPKMQGASEIGSTFIPGQEPELAPGVTGILFDEKDMGIIVSAIFATNPGNGDVARFLNTLPRDRRVTFPTVISPKLEAMLLRRNFKKVVLNDPQHGQYGALRREKEWNSKADLLAYAKEFWHKTAFRTNIDVVHKEDGLTFEVLHAVFLRCEALQKAIELSIGVLTSKDGTTSEQRAEMAVEMLSKAVE
jgi:hypothetical protein